MSPAAQAIETPGYTASNNSHGPPPPCCIFSCWDYYPLSAFRGYEPNFSLFLFLPCRRCLLLLSPPPLPPAFGCTVVRTNQTDRAAAHLISLVVNKPGKVGVRLGVKRRGCNGMSYTLKYADEKPEGDEEVVVQAVSPPAANSAASTPQRGASGGPDGDSSSGDAVPAAAGGGGDVRLFVDPMATLYIAGTVMDWEETELASEFTFTNPNAKGECGCGESFNV